MVTIKDVAKAAKVSTATVSLVMNNHKRISPSTRARVLQAVKKLNYHPSRSARGLVSNRTGNVGFILREDHFSKSEPFYTKVFLGTEFQAREDEYYVLLTTVPAAFKKGDSLPRFVLERNIDGIILAGKVPQALVEGLQEFAIPLIFADYYPPQGEHPAVLIDNISGGMKAANHLIRCGHKQIAFVGGDQNHPSIAERLQGFKLALEKAGLPIDPSSIVANEPTTDLEGGYRAAAQLFSRRPDVTAVFTCNDAMAIGVLRYLREKNLRVPAEVSLIGFDDVDTGVLLDPPLTTLRVPKEEIGSRAQQLFVETLRHKNKRPHKVLIPVELVVRKSTRHLKGAS